VAVDAATEALVTLQRLRGVMLRRLRGALAEAPVVATTAGRLSYAAETLVALAGTREMAVVAVLVLMLGFVEACCCRGKALL
jgi:hypothetical protein